jgi:Protein of unknown function (DUF2794)
MALDPPPLAAKGASVFFERRELNRILLLYGRMVAAGEWRDYAIDALSDACIFSVFRRATEAPAYRIEKRPALAKRQGAWAVIGEGGMVLKRGQELEQVLTVFDSRKFRVVD